MAHTPSFPHDSFLAKWLAGELTDAEWNAWKEEAGEEELQRIINTVDQWEVPATRTKDEAWAQFAAGLQDIEEKSTPVRSLRPLRWISVAAAVIVLTGVAYLFRDTTQTYTTGIGGKELVSLPDGSSVQLNANSSLSFDPANWEDDRSVQLDGEAFFSVAEGKKFTVSTDQGTVSVLGTSFNVHDRPESWSVQCYTGKVEVKSQAQTLILTAGERAELSSDLLEELTFEANQEQLWTSDFVRFDDVLLSEVVAELERQYEIELVWPEGLSPNQSYTGGFPHGNLDNALQMVFGPSNYLPKLKDGENKVYLSPR